ncbi:hypothetical protein [Streptomyces sp. 8L]|uniref:hypothetical protein n=1 Tax=Streptomyces sp. 8L TaxID=2877242 RepID=UPI0027E02F22|nr:hypothetical protein [Streptomyces sp. 8L]
MAITTGLYGSGSDTWVDFTQRTHFDVSTHTPLPWRGMLEQRVKPLHDLMALCLGRPLAMSTLLLRPADHAQGNLCRAYFDAIRPPTTAGSILGYGSPTLLTAHDRLIDTGALVTRWYDRYQEFRPVLAPLLAPLYAPFIHSEHRFASSFQALEALAANKNLYDTRDLARERHAERVRQALNALDREGRRLGTCQCVPRRGEADGRHQAVLARRDPVLDHALPRPRRGGRLRDLRESGAEARLPPRCGGGRAANGLICPPRRPVGGTPATERIHSRDPPAGWCAAGTTLGSPGDPDVKPITPRGSEPTGSAGSPPRRV